MAGMMRKLTPSVVTHAKLLRSDVHFRTGIGGFRGMQNCLWSSAQVATRTRRYSLCTNDEQHAHQGIFVFRCSTFQSLEFTI